MPKRSILKPVKTLSKPNGLQKFETKWSGGNPHASPHYLRGRDLDPSLFEKLGIREFGINNYLHSKLDRLDLVEIKNIDVIQGKGLVAKKFIPKGTCIGEYTGDIHTIEAFENANTDNSYAMKVGNYYVDSKVNGNFVRYVNYSDTQENVEFRECEEDGRTIAKVFALSDIPAGMQILADYNTHDSQMAKNMIFINPQDGEESYQQKYQNYRDYYEQVNTMQMPVFRLNAGDPVLHTKLALAVLKDGEYLKNLENEEIIRQVTLPCFLLKKDQNGIPIFKESVTLLMLTCYRGEISDVEWLVEHGLPIDQQTNYTGVNAIFSALAGFKTNAQEDRRMSCREIMCYLIEKGAKLTCHNRANKTFLHLLLQLDTFLPDVLNALKKRERPDLDKLLDYIDNNDDDIIMSCLRNRKWQYLQGFLEIYQDYFTNNYDPTETDAREHLQKIISEYDEDTLKYLLEMLEKLKIKYDPPLFEQKLSPVAGMSHQN